MGKGEGAVPVVEEAEGGTGSAMAGLAAWAVQVAAVLGWVEGRASDEAVVGGEGAGEGEEGLGAEAERGAREVGRVAVRDLGAEVKELVAPGEKAVAGCIAGRSSRRHQC